MLLKWFLRAKIAIFFSEGNNEKIADEGVAGGDQDLEPISDEEVQEEVERVPGKFSMLGKNDFTELFRKMLYNFLNSSIF